MLSGVQTGNGVPHPHDRYDICSIAHAHTNRKNDIFIKDNCTLTKHTWRWTYSALRYFFIENQKIWTLPDFNFSIGKK